MPVIGYTNYSWGYKGDYPAQTQRMMDIAVAIAKEANSIQPTTPRQGAVLRLSSGVYYQSSNILNKKHMIQTGFKHDAHYLHAEMAVLLKALKEVDDVSYATLYVAKMFYNKNIGNGKPCIGCEKVLKKRGITRFFYTKLNFD